MRALTLALGLCLLLPCTAQAAEGGPLAAASALWDGFIAWIFDQQRAFHRELLSGLSLLSEERSLLAAGGLMLASFLYGVFHAPGPGHGKAVLTAYLATHPERLARGVGLAGAAALAQGLVAIVLVYGLVYVAGLLPRDANRAVDWSERAAFALVTVMGAYLVWRAGRGLLRLVRVAPAGAGPAGLVLLPATASASVAGGEGAAHAHTEIHAHSHAHAHAHGHAHGHDHPHGACEGCGHAHGPTPEQIERASGLRASLGVILSIGLRPCSGAVIVLVFANAAGIALAGIGAVLAMAAGTALAIALLAVFAIQLRTLSARLVPEGAGGLWRFGGPAVSLVGGVLLIAIGTSLLGASFAPAHPLGL